MTQVTPRLATPPDPLALPKTTGLEFAWAGQKSWAVLGEMLTPHTHCAKTLLMGSLHGLDP